MCADMSRYFANLLLVQHCIAVVQQQVFEGSSPHFVGGIDDADGVLWCGDQLPAALCDRVLY
jgi:hypothetical protein